MNELPDLAERLRLANPVSDPANPPTGAAGADVVLLQIERRSIIMHETETKTPDTTSPPRRWSGAWMAVAGFAAVIAIVVGAIAVFGGGGVEPTATTVAPVTTEAPPTTTQATTTTTPTTTVPAEAFPGLPEPTGDLELGSYAVRQEPIPLSFTLPEANSDVPSGMFWAEEPDMPGPGIVKSPGAAFSGMLVFATTRANDDLAVVVEDLTGEIPISESTDTVVGGRPAVQLDVDESIGEVPFSSLSGGDGGSYRLLGNDYRIRFYIVDTIDGTLVIWMEATPDDWDTLGPYWEEVITSIEFAPDTP